MRPVRFMRGRFPCFGVAFAAAVFAALPDVQENEMVERMQPTSLSPHPPTRRTTLPKRNFPAALEKEVERLRESTVALTQRLLDSVAEAERASKTERDAIQAKTDEAAEVEVAAAVAAAREEETARCRAEMETALAEVREGGNRRGGAWSRGIPSCACVGCVCVGLLCVRAYVRGTCVRLFFCCVFGLRVEGAFC